MYNTFNEQTLTWALPFPLFQTSSYIPPHTKVELDFNVNSQWYNEILSCYGAFPAGKVVPLPASGVNATPNSIGVGIDDISIWVFYCKEPTPVNMVKEIPLKQYFSQIHTITINNESFTLTLPNGGRNVTHILGAFLQTRRGGTVKASSNDFSDGYIETAGATGGDAISAHETKNVLGAVTNLQMIRFTLDKSYPNPDYDMCFSSAISTNSKDVSRAFYDFINNADSKFDRSGNNYSIQNYLVEPCFCYKVNTDTTTYNETLQVYINMFSGDGGSTTGYKPGMSQLLVVALYDETLRLSFDSEKIINVELVS